MNTNNLLAFLAGSLGARRCAAVRGLPPGPTNAGASTVGPKSQNWAELIPIEALGDVAEPFLGIHVLIPGQWVVDAWFPIEILKSVED